MSVNKNLNKMIKLFHTERQRKCGGIDEKKEDWMSV